MISSCGQEWTRRRTRFAGSIFFCLGGASVYDDPRQAYRQHAIIPIPPMEAYPMPLPVTMQELRDFARRNYRQSFPRGRQVFAESRPTRRTEDALNQAVERARAATAAQPPSLKARR